VIVVARPKLVFPKETVEKLKAFFSDNMELAEALDANSVRAWEIVNEKWNELGTLHHELSMAGFPARED